jgi:hypothetical protein
MWVLTSPSYLILQTGAREACRTVTGNESAPPCYTTDDASQTLTGYLIAVTGSSAAKNSRLFQGIPASDQRLKRNDMRHSGVVTLERLRSVFVPPLKWFFVTTSSISEYRYATKASKGHTRTSISRMPTQPPLAAHGRLRAATIRSPSKQTKERSVRVNSHEVICACCRLTEYPLLAARLRGTRYTKLG